MGNKTSREYTPRNTEDDMSTILHNLNFSHVISQYLYVVAKLDVATILGRANKSLTAEEIAKELGGSVNVDYLERILRVLSATKGIFKEKKSEEDTPAFGLTDLSEMLRSDINDRVTYRNIILVLHVPPKWKAWARVEECVKSQVPKNPFEIENSLPLYEYHKVNPESAEIFNKAMTQMTDEDINAIMPAYPWTNLEKHKATVVDVGGGHGHFMKKLKAQCPGLNCIVLELKGVVESGSEEHSGVHFVIGDFFKPETLPEADVIFMKRILQLIRLSAP